MELILKVKNLGDRNYAEFIYHREMALHPEWELKAAFEALKEKQ